MTKIRVLARNVLNVLPNEGRNIKALAHNLIMHKSLMISKLTQYQAGIKLPDPRIIQWIDPKRIEYHTALKNGSLDWEDWVFPQNKNLKLIQSGEWDILNYHVSDMRISRAIDARIGKGASWNSSDYYQVAVDNIERGRILWGCASRTDFDKHCVRIDRLIESIARDGYQDSKVLGNISRLDSLLGQNEILINISRDGFPLFQDGRHRLAIACALGLKKVPVQVLVRHSEWQVFRDFMHRMAHGSGGASKEGLLYQRATHFDLSDVPSEHACEDRWETISKHVPVASETALDIGCNLGYFCHKLEDLGYTCFGIEYFPDIAHAARKIARAEKRHLAIVTGDVLAAEALNDIGTVNFSIVIALNIFHHFIKTERGYIKLQEFLKRTRIKTMFFEAHHPDDPQMQGVFYNPSPEEFVNLIKVWGNFQSVLPIHSVSDGRTIYKLSR